MAGFNIVVPASVSPTPGATANVGATQNSITRQFAATGTAPTIGEADQCMIQSSNDNFVSDISNLVLLNAGDPPKPVVTIAQYYRAIRTIVASGSTGMNVNMADEVPTSGAGALAIVNGGQAGPLVIGTTNATSMTFIANNITEAVLSSNGSSVWGSTSGASTTTVQAGTGGITVDAAGPLGLGNTSATSITVGNNGNALVALTAGGTGVFQFSAGTGTSFWNVGSGGTLQILAAAVPATLLLGTGAAAISATLGSNNSTSATTVQAGSGNLIVNSTTGDVDLGTGNGGVDTNAKTVRLATGAGVKTLTMGSTNTTSITTVQAGSNGIQLVGAVLFGNPVAVGDGTGSLGSAATTVDISSRLVVTQTTAVIAQANMRLLQVPTITTAGRRCIVENATGSTASFTVGDVSLKQGVNLNPGEACEFEFDGAAWNPLGATVQDPIQGAALADGVGTSARAGQITQYTLPAATLSAPRVNTLSTTGARKGDVMIISRLDVTANTYTVTGAESFVMPNSKINFAQFRYDGAAWQFVSGGSQ